MYRNQNPANSAKSYSSELLSLEIISYLVALYFAKDKADWEIAQKKFGISSKIEIIRILEEQASLLIKEQVSNQEERYARQEKFSLETDIK